MKKILCLVICVLMALSICACKAETPAPNEIETNAPTIPSEEVAPSEQVAPTETVVETEAPPATEETPQTEAPTKEETPPEEEATEPPAETTPPVESSSSVELKYSQVTYTVNDPNNTKGLSTTSNGFSYGVAKDGVPHNQSVVNQQTFDGYDNVDALALDTKTQGKVMYLTFDNGYEYENLTADILDTLKEKNVKAAFFITMSYAQQNPELVQRMIREGHIVGNHSTTHPSFPKLTRTQMAEEIAELDNYMLENFSYTSPYFRFPSGEYSECALELVTSLGFKSVFWSVAHADWDTTAQKGADNAFTTVTSRFHPGAVILLHAVSQDNADALGRMIDEAWAQGYTFKTLDDYSY